MAVDERRVLALLAKRGVARRSYPMLEYDPVAAD